MGIINHALDSLNWPSLDFIIAFFTWLGPFGLSGLIFVIVLLFIVIHAYITRRSNDQPDPEHVVIPPQQTTLALPESWCEFHEDRTSVFSIITRLGQAEEVFALWHSGIRGRDDILQQIRITKLIVIDPAPPSVINNARRDNTDIVWDHAWTRTVLERKDLSFFEQEQKNIKEGIRYITRKAFERHIDVRWHSLFVGNTVTIANPRSDNGWIVLDLFGPLFLPDHRPSVIIERKRHPRIYDRLVRLYDIIWEHGSRKPSEQEHLS